MRELIEAAEAVIGRWDRSPLSVDSLTMNDLRAAVEQAEKQEAVGFEEWIKATPWTEWTAKSAWIAAQQAERERIKDIVVELIYPEDPWIHYSTILEKIDASTDS